MAQGADSVNFDLIQNGSLVSGKGYYSFLQNQEKIVYVTGDVDGSVKGNNFNIHIFWNYRGHIAVYDGTISPQGKIEGEGYGKEDPSKKFLWYFRESAKCTAASSHADPPPAAQSQPIHHTPGTISTGHSRVTTPTPEVVFAPSRASGMTVPGIIAVPNNIALVKGKSKGTTTLTWDAGRAHQSAELWVKVDDEDETQVAAAGKGTLAVAVIPGKSYLYTLRDAGKTLARIIVEFHR